MKGSPEHAADVVEHGVAVALVLKELHVRVEQVALTTSKYHFWSGV